mmetsp:Transcript_31458/g.51927  ORF Transcript_31458/g.51927 Transcript_31458/m.51927 type:complete len:378 (+) Transcript_31458:295-1428(+)
MTSRTNGILIRLLRPSTDDDDDDDDEEEAARPTKRLRSCDTDLTIVVGGEGSDKNQQKTYEYHSQIMAMHSRYVDAMLATPMKEKRSRTITFPEIDPSDWEQMMQYLQPVASPPTTTQAVLRVLPWYDKYEFQDGLRLCDAVLTKLLTFQVENVGQLSDYVQAAGAAYQHQLPRTKIKCLSFCRELFRKREARLGLTPVTISAFVPVLHEEHAVWQKVVGLIGPMAGNPEKDAILANPFFPDLLVRAILSTDYEYNLDKKVSSIRVRNSGWAGVNGTYNRVTTTAATGNNNGTHHDVYEKITASFESYFVAKRTGDGVWLLCRREPLGGLLNRQAPGYTQKVLFVSKAHPLSILPPRGGWEPFENDYAIASPIIKFD